MTDEPTRPWYRRPGLLAALALLVLALGFGVGLLLAAGDDGDQVDTTDTTVTSVAPTAPPTTAPADDPAEHHHDRARGPVRRRGPGGV